MHVNLFPTVHVHLFSSLTADIRPTERVTFSGFILIYLSSSPSSVPRTENPVCKRIYLKDGMIPKWTGYVPGLSNPVLGVVVKLLGTHLHTYLQSCCFGGMQRGTLVFTKLFWGTPFPRSLQYAAGEKCSEKILFQSL